MSLELRREMSVGVKDMRASMVPQVMGGGVLGKARQEQVLREFRGVPGRCRRRGELQGRKVRRTPFR